MPPALENPYLQWFVLTAALWGLSQFGLRKELRPRALLFGGLIIACLVAIWPPYDMGDREGKIRLGLDLQGGTHLVMQVVTNDALEAIVDDAVQSIRNQVSQKGIAFGSVTRSGQTKLSVEGIEPARGKDVNDILKDTLGRDWEIHETAVGAFSAQMTALYTKQLEERTVSEAMKTLGRRVNELGVAEPVIARHGDDGDQILVQLPGLSDVEQAKKVMGQTAQLALKLVENVSSSKESLFVNGQAPPGMEIVPGFGAEAGEREFFLLQREAVVTGRDLKNARVSVDELNAPAISFTLKPQGAERLKRATGDNLGRRLAIVLDDRVESAPTIQGRISDNGQITGRFSPEEAADLARVLRAGALPATMRYLQERSVGASLGRDSIRAGVTASMFGLLFIALFMVTYYRFSGINAVVALSANLLILLGVMAGIDATLTLPGIAGVILTVGVGVDTNVLIFERIREELRAGKTIKAAVANGFDRVLITIIDTHATGLIAAALLFQFGTGPIKGFAVTLFIGLVANVIASFFMSRFLFDWTLGRGATPRLSI